MLDTKCSELNRVMKKFIKISLAILLSISCLVACGDAGTNKPEGNDRQNRNQETETAQTTEQNSETGANESESTQQSENQTTQNQNQSPSGMACPSNSGALQVIGTQLCDENGNPVMLRGVSTHGIAWFPDYINASAVKEFHEEWGANVLRLAMYTAEYNGYCSGGDKEWLKSLVKNGVSYATQNDMYVIIDWHILSDGNPHTYKEDAKAFFQEMSATYASYDNVIYEICNEPNGGTTWADIKSYAEEIIPVIRANDSDAIIIVGTPNWCQYVKDAAADPITGYDNIMYALHFYAATHTDWLRNDMVSALDAGLPIFVSEYGICDASGNGAIDEAQANAWIELLNEKGVSYCGWNISNKAETSAIFNSSCTKTSGWTQEDLSTSGKWQYDMLQKYQLENQ